MSTWKDKSDGELHQDAKGIVLEILERWAHRVFQQALCEHDIENADQCTVHSPACSKCKKCGTWVRVYDMTDDVSVDTKPSGSPAKES